MHNECYHKMYQNEERHWWFKGKIDIVRKLMERFVGGDPNVKRVLDAGCGTSFLSKSLIPNPHNLYNVDNDELSLFYSKKRGVLNLIKSDLYAMPFDVGFFDLCFCMDVIEHNKDDGRLVRELARVIKPGGHIIASVPALMSLWGPQDIKLEHFKRYNKNEFATLFADDFEILKLSYFNTFLFLPIYIFRKIFNLFPSFLKSKDELDINNGTINNFLYKIFSQEANFLKYINFPLGVSCIIVARKK